MVIKEASLQALADAFADNMRTYFRARFEKDFDFDPDEVSVWIERDEMRFGMRMVVRMGTLRIMRGIEADLLRERSSRYHDDYARLVMQDVIRQAGAVLLANLVTGALKAKGDEDAITAFENQCMGPIQEVIFKGQGRVEPDTVVVIRLNDVLQPFTESLHNIITKPREFVAKLLMVCA